MRREPEPEIMAGAEEAAAYAGAAAMRYLSRIDDSFVRQCLAAGIRHGHVLDVGTGPGVIPLKLLACRPALRVTAVDLSDSMLALARENAAVHPCGARVRFARGDAKELPYADGSFDAVISNSLLHHLRNPLPFLDAVARVVKPGGAIVMRDIRRPPSGLYWAWWRWFGRYYHGQMLASYQASLRAAFTARELRTLIVQSHLRACRVVHGGLTHISIVRACAAGL